MKLKLSYLMLILGLTFMTSCTKEPIDQTTIVEEEFEPEVISCDLDVVIQKEVLESSIVLSAVPTGGTAPYQYNWSTGDSDENTLVYTAGEYIVNIIDAEGCNAQASITINNAGEECDDFIAFMTVDTITLELIAGAVGGTPPYYYLWSTNDTGQSIFVNDDGDYSVSVTDSAGCVATSTVSVDGYEECYNFNGTLSYDQMSGIMQANIIGGTAPFTYEWSTGETTETILVNNNGVYTIIVTDANGCAFYAEYNVSIDPCNNLDTYFLHDTLYNELIAMPSGGSPPYTLFWSTGETTETISILTDGEHTLTVTDSEGCTAFYSQFVFIFLPCDFFQVDFFHDPVASTLSASTIQGTAPFTYLWNTGETTETINVTLGNTYTVDIADANGCTASGQFNL